MIHPMKLFKSTLISLSLSLFILTPPAGAQESSVAQAKHRAESQIRNLTEPVLSKYCNESCKLLSVNVAVDIATPDQFAPGFDESENAKDPTLQPSAATLKLLMDQQVGPAARKRITDLLSQYLETLDYPVKIDTQVAQFPHPVGTENKVGELREKVIHQFRSTMDGLFNQFCPEQCLLADFNVQTEAVSPEEAQNTQPGEVLTENGVSLRIKTITGTLLMDDALSPEERNNVLEMAKLKTNSFKNVDLQAKSMKFPHPETYAQKVSREGGANRSLASSLDSKSDSKKNETSAITTNSTHNKTDNNSANTSETNSSKAINTTQTSEATNRQEKFERIEKIERVENGDAVQAELKKFQFYGLILGCAILSLLVFLAMASMRQRKGNEEGSTISRIINQVTNDPASSSNPGIALPSSGSSNDNEGRHHLVAMRYEIQRIQDELMAVFSQQPQVAKQVFSRILTEEGVEHTAKYVQIFGESVVVDMMRDPSLQGDISELMEFYARNPQELKDDEKLDLLRKLHNRTVAGKLIVMGSRSTHLFDFLAEMDGLQIMELIRNEALTVKGIVMTQVDPQKRAAIYAQLEEDIKMKLLTELSRIDYLPRDYIFNVANALKRKKRDNPRLNTEALPGSEVLVNLLERTSVSVQRNVVKSLQTSHPDSARIVKTRLVSLDTLRYLKDNQLLEVVLSLRHDELLTFLKGAAQATAEVILQRCPKELTEELLEEMASLGPVTREAYTNVERKILNRVKVMSNDGMINLAETNERMFGDASASYEYAPETSNELPRSTGENDRTMVVNRRSSA